MSTIREEILSGMATILWGSAWADHAEEARCTNLSGEEITNIMPDIPKEAHEHAARIAAEYEKLNGVPVEALYERAVEADKREVGAMPYDGLPAREEPGTPEWFEAYAERFGECLAYEAMGAGVSWEDDHAEFEHEAPYDAGEASCELQDYAAETCAVCKGADHG